MTTTNTTKPQLTAEYLTTVLDRAGFAASSVTGQDAYDGSDEYTSGFYVQPMRAVPACAREYADAKAGFVVRYRRASDASDFNGTDFVNEVIDAYAETLKHAGIACEVTWAFEPGEDTSTVSLYPHHIFIPNQDEPGEDVPASWAVPTLKPVLTAANVKAEVARRAGCIRINRSGLTGHYYGLYNAVEGGFDPAGGPYVTVCEDHGAIANHRTRELAKKHLPTGDWCEACQDELRAKQGGAK